MDELVEHRALLPGKYRPDQEDDAFYFILFDRTWRFREELYVTMEVEGYTFKPRPGSFEHFPVGWCEDREAGVFVKRSPDEPFEATFRCYSPAGSGVAAEGVRRIREALAGMEAELANTFSPYFWPGMRYERMRRRHLRGLLRPAYRPLEVLAWT